MGSSEKPRRGAQAKRAMLTPRFPGSTAIVRAARLGGDEWEPLAFAAGDGRVRHINGQPIDARLLQCVAEELARRADEWVSSKVLFVAGLLADEHYRDRRRAFAEHRLGSVTPRGAAPARCRLFTQVLQVPGDVVDRTSWRCGPAKEAQHQLKASIGVEMEEIARHHGLDDWLPDVTPELEGPCHRDPR